MKTYTAHNTKLVQENSWATTDKKPHIVIDDAKNRYGFVITFGKLPSVEIWKIKKNGDLTKRLANIKVKKD